ncbi:hypothetical protein M5X05_16695 [Paenibacillus alvei]|nr:hypothetical protein [Paenibacillus alvei]MCY9705812.1 hypothetical protein [Paenibacillus alvei]
MTPRTSLYHQSSDSVVSLQMRKLQRFTEELQTPRHIQMLFITILYGSPNPYIAEIFP